MYRICFHGRGGQGIKMASRVLGTALFRSGFTVQDAPKYGAERRGAPIFSTVRAQRDGAAALAINERGVVHQPDLVVVADDTLLAVPAAGVLQGITADTVLLVNSRESPATWRHRLNFAGLLLVLPVEEGVEDRAELPYIGATCAGAAACLLGVIAPAVLESAIAEELATYGDHTVSQNQENARAAFEAVVEHQGVVDEGALVAATDYRAPAWVELPLDEASIAAPDIRAVANSVQVRTGLWRTLRPVIEYQHCKGCWWVCSTFCPDSAISVVDDVPVIDYDHCKGCMICVGICPPHAIASLPEHTAQEQEREATVQGGGHATDPVDR